jgi:hypothetical protein
MHRLRIKYIKRFNFIIFLIKLNVLIFSILKLQHANKIAATTYSCSSHMHFLGLK